MCTSTDSSYVELNDEFMNKVVQQSSKQFFRRKRKVKCSFCNETNYRNNIISKHWKVKEYCNTGIRCTTCQRIICRDCVICLLDSIKGKSKEDPWYKIYNKCIQENINHAVMCHCCQFKLNLRQPAPLLSSQPLGKFSGSLYYPEFNLIILSPSENIVDVLSMGNYKPSSSEMNMDSTLSPIRGAWHCVLSNQLCNSLHQKQIEGKSITNADIRSIDLDLTLPMLDGTFQKFKTRIFDLGDIEVEDMSYLKGTNDFEIDQFKNCIVFGERDMISKDDDIRVSIVIGSFKDSDEAMLLNMRFHEAVESGSGFGPKFFSFAKKGGRLIRNEQLNSRGKFRKYISIGKKFREVCYTFNICSK